MELREIQFIGRGEFSWFLGDGHVMIFKGFYEMADAPLKEPSMEPGELTSCLYFVSFITLNDGQ
jgi:hypothetical protein